MPPQPILMGESFSLCFLRMMEVFSFVHTHVLAAEEPPVHLILLFSNKILQFSNSYLSLFFIFLQHKKASKTLT